MPAIVYRIAFAAFRQEPVKILLCLKEVKESKRAVRVKVMEIVEYVKVTDVQECHLQIARRNIRILSHTYVIHTEPDLQGHDVTCLVND